MKTLHEPEMSRSYIATMINPTEKRLSCTLRRQNGYERHLR